MPYTVQATGICKTFAHRQVLDHVDLAIDQGSVLGLLGPNGAGKTTLVRILATLLRPDAGAAIVAGHDLLADPVGVKRSISLTGQYAAVDDVLTGRENLEMMARLLRVPRRSMASRVAELLAAFDLAAGGEWRHDHALREHQYQHGGRSAPRCRECEGGCYQSRDSELPSVIRRRSCERGQHGKRP